MADKAEKKPEGGGERKDSGKSAAPAPAGGSPPPAAKAHGGGGLLSKTPVILGAVMFLEAIVLFAGFKFLSGGAKNANAADMTMNLKKDGSTDATPGGDASKDVEIELVDSRFPNKQSGREFLYDVNIFISVKPDDADRIKKLIADRDALIKDRVATIIAESDPDKLGGGSEPGMETLRRQVKYQLDEIVGEGSIDEVLIPRCIPFRTDY